MKTRLVYFNSLSGWTILGEVIPVTYALAN